MLEKEEKYIDAEETLARSLFEQCEFGEATRLFQHVLEAREKLVRPEDKETLLTLHYLEISLRENRQYSEVETVDRASIQRHEKVLGLVSWVTMQVVYGLAYTLEYQERFYEAIISYERVLSGHRKLLPPNHEKITKVVEHYDRMLDKMKAKGSMGKEKKEEVNIEQVANETAQELDLHRFSL